MASRPFSQLHSEIRQLSTLKESERYEVEYALPMAKLIIDCFSIDISQSLSASLHSLLWQTMKGMIDKVKGQSIASSLAHANLENAFNICLSWLVDLALVVQKNYDVNFRNVPEFMILPTSVRDPSANTVKHSESRQFQAFIGLRIGDLMRYKGKSSLAESLYLSSAHALPMIGDAWNQLGLLAAIRGQPLHSLYYHFRALHCKHSFVSASTNIQRSLAKFVDIDVVPSACFSERLLSVLAKCHFLRPVSKDIVETVGEEITDIYSLIPVISVYSDLGTSSDEKKFASLLKKIIERCAEGTIDRIMDEQEVTSLPLSDLWLIAMCLRVCPIRVTNENKLETFVERLRKWNAHMKDREYLFMFTAIPNSLPHPLSTTSLADLIEKRTNDGEGVEKQSGKESQSQFKDLNADVVELTDSSDDDESSLDMEREEEEESDETEEEEEMGQRNESAKRSPQTPKPRLFRLLAVLTSILMLPAIFD